MAKRKTDEQLPRSLQRLWQRADPKARTASRALSLERVVAAAVELADAEGLPALSMGRLAARLECAPMSLYRHVANKDELHLFMMDIAPGPPPPIEPGARDWRGGLERWARALRATYHRHPWILQVVMGRPPLEPGQLAWFDCGLRCMTATRLKPAEKVSVILLVLNFVRGEAQIATGLLQAHKRTSGQQQELEAWYGRMLAKLVDPERFPALAQLAAAGVFGTGEADGGAADFEFGLARIMDGVELLLRRRRRRSS